MEPAAQTDHQNLADTSHRTFVCSVLFLDIVEYSKKPVSEQLSLKQRFNALLLNALRHVATADRIVLDTGDGAAVSFLGNPEDCLFAAMALRDGIAAESPDLQPALKVRIGINLGPVRLIKDINGQLNIIGDGINVAQRVMSFADPGVILVSRSYYEVVSCLSEDFLRLFQYEGTHTDKHVREHSVYRISPGTKGIAQPPAQAATNPSMATTWNQAPAATAPAPDAAAASNGATAPVGFDASSTNTLPPTTTGPTSPNRTRLWAAVGAAVVLVGGALLSRMERKPEAARPAETAKAEATDKAAAAPVAEKKKAADAKEKPAAETKEKAAANVKEKAAEPKVAVSLAIMPWGEVYVDGQQKGVSPPLKTLSLTPGPHRIEVRNADFPAYVTTMDAKAGAKITVQHKF